jgi:hypothetical protein
VQTKIGERIKRQPSLVGKTERGMNIDEQTYWRLHQYLKGDLKGGDLQTFQAELKHNSDLREEAELFGLADKALKQNRLLQAEKVAFQVKNEMKQQVSSFTKYLGMGCGLLALLSVSGWVYLSSEKVENKTVQVQTTDTKTIPVSVNSEVKENVAVDKLPIKQQEKTALKVPVKAVVGKQDAMDEHSVLTQQTVVEAKETALAEISKTASQPEAMQAKHVQPEAVVDLDAVCRKRTFEAHISALPACFNEQNGSVMVTKMKGGDAPYRVTIMQDKSQKAMNAEQLSAGTYHVLLADASGCEKNIGTVKVKEQACDKDEMVFNPFVGEHLSFPAYREAGELKIYDKAGNVLLKREIGAEETFSWDGISARGEMLAGHFVYEIHYQDGSHKNGTLTLSR